MHTYINKWKPIEIAVLLALAVTLLVGAASLHRQDGLQEKMIRLHVIANSDSEGDQAMKLLARDAVLTRAEAILRQASNREEAMEDLNAALPELERTAYDACGGAYPVHAALEMTEFPRKEYDGFALPAGETWRCASSSARVPAGTGGVWCTHRCVWPPAQSWRTRRCAPGWTATMCSLSQKRTADMC